MKTFVALLTLLLIVSGCERRGYEARQSVPSNSELGRRVSEQTIEFGVNNQTVCLRATTPALQWETRQQWIPYVQEAVRREISVNCRVTYGKQADTRAPQQKLQSSGTGFIINRSGHAITNAHVVESCSLLKARLPDKTSVDATVIARDEQNDLAAVKLSSAPANWAQFSLGGSTRPGDEAVAYGFPLPGALASGGNVTTGNISALAGLRDDTRYYQITVPVQLGNSGGPLLDANGNVIGVVTSKLNALQVARVTGDIPQNVNFALKATLVQAFLNSNGIAYETDEGEDGLSAVDVGERAKHFTIRLDCFK